MVDITALTRSNRHGGGRPVRRRKQRRGGDAEDADITGTDLRGPAERDKNPEFDINYYSQLEDNEWDRISSRNRNLTFEYDRDTYILDFSDGEERIIDADDFFQGDYADERTSKSSRDYYVLRRRRRRQWQGR